LAEIALVLGEELQLVWRLDPLGHHAQSHSVAESDHGSDKWVTGALSQLGDERPVDLENVDGKLSHPVQS